MSSMFSNCSSKSNILSLIKASFFSLANLGFVRTPRLATLLINVDKSDCASSTSNYISSGSK